MDLSIRKAVLDNIRSSSVESVKEIISDATSSDVETTLPGLGVMFEVLWKNSPEQERNHIVDCITRSLK